MDFWRFFRGSENPSVLGVHGFSGSRKNSKRRELRRKSRFWPNKLFIFACLSFACLLLVPTGTQYPAGSPKLKSSEFWWKKTIPKTAKIRWIFGVLDGFVRRRVLVVRNWARFRQNAEKALISSQTSLLTKQTLYIRLFVFCLFVPCPHGYPVSRGVPKIKIVRILMKKNYPKNGKN